MSQPHVRQIAVMITKVCLLIGLMFAVLWPAYPAAAQSEPAVDAQFSCDAVSEIPDAECVALVTLYRAMGGDSWRNRDNWLANTTPCDWFGVVCDNNENVTRLYLDKNGLTGELPSELQDLTELTVLQLNENSIEGTISVEIANLSALLLLRLEDNQLTGSIPPELGGLTQLEKMSLAGNLLEGNIPPALGNLTQLRSLVLDQNRLSGSIPAELGNLSELTVFSLSQNPTLVGAIPTSFTKLDNLSYLHYLQTGLCEPTDAEFQAWLMAVPDSYIMEVPCDLSTAAQNEPISEPTAEAVAAIETTATAAPEPTSAAIAAVDATTTDASAAQPSGVSTVNLHIAQTAIIIIVMLVLIVGGVFYGWWIANLREKG